MLEYIISIVASLFIALDLAARQFRGPSLVYALAVAGYFLASLYVISSTVEWALVNCDSCSKTLAKSNLEASDV